jgi:hypothetical protein
MALTMTRTRTQTTLTKPAELVANVHGELAFVEGLLAARGPGSVPGMAPDVTPALGLPPEVLARLALRQLELVDSREALYATVRQFDPGVEPAGIGAAYGWRKRYRPCLRGPELIRRYLVRLPQPGDRS